MFYASLDDDGVCVGISDISSTIDNDPSYIDGSWTAEIVLLADYQAEFIDTNPEPIEVVERVAPEGREWRDLELRITDFIVPTTDHPQHAAYMTYRAALRSWPSTSDFPDTKPTLGE